MRKSRIFLAVFGLAGAAAFAGDLTVEAQFHVAGTDTTKAFLTVKGAQASVEKDTLDAVSGASRNKATEVWNKYRLGADKKPTLPAGLQNLFKYGVAPAKMFEADGLKVAKAKDGVITIQYVHRGTAYLMATDKTGTLTLPLAAKARTVAVLDKTGNNVIAKVFSSTGKIGDLDWAKVWDETVPDGAVIAKVADASGKVIEVKTGKVVIDAAASAQAFTGKVNVTFDGTWMSLIADLTTK